MGLRESRIINSVHPWFGARLQWLARVATLYGGVQLLISGNRTVEEQRKLYRAGGDRPVAAPGCSQHQYGYAADAVWQPFQQITSKGKGFIFSQEETNRTMSEAAAIAGLTTVSNDPGHLQVFNGVQFKSWATRMGFCARPNRMDEYVRCLNNVSGAFNTILRDVQTSGCFRRLASRQLAEESERQGFTVRGTF